MDSDEVVTPTLDLPPLDEIEAELQSRDLSEFTRGAWGAVDPDTYRHNWHLDAISEHLTAVNRGEIQKLIINIPPRHMKSLGAAVMWPAWTWQLPKTGYRFGGAATRFMYVSYAQALSIRDSTKTRRLIESPWYQRQFPNRFKITSDQNTKIRFDTDKGGYRLATSVGGALTGEGGDIVVIDDPHNAREILSQVKREGVTTWWREAMSTRRNQSDGAYVVVMQRLHSSDLVGHILEHETGWTHLCIPARYERKHKYVFMGDPRTKEGELLWPGRFDEPALKDMETNMGTYAAAGQMQQRPAPRDGGLFNQDHFKIVELKDVPANIRWVRYWDLAGTDTLTTSNPDWTVGLLMGKVQLTKDHANWYIRHVVRYRMLGLQIRLRINAQAALDGKHVIIGLPQDPGQAGKEQYASYASGLAGYRVMRFLEVNEGDKVMRAANGPAPQVEAGNVFLVRGDWNQDYLDEMGLFPNGDHLDQADATSGAFYCLEKPAPGGVAVAAATVPVAVPAALIISH